MPLFVIGSKIDFPNPNDALAEGLLAIGGDLHPQRLIAAYKRGIFPWYTEKPVLWWSPDPRCVIYPSQFRVAKSLKRTLKRQDFSLALDRDFNAVICNCARVTRPHQTGSWIVPDMIAAYNGLHQQGLAHSFEIYIGDKLAGGLYGVSLGQIFFAESMFFLVADCSKLALASLVEFSMRMNFKLIDCQLANPHLLSLGACEIPRQDYLQAIKLGLTAPTLVGNWSRYNKVNFYQHFL